MRTLFVLAISGSFLLGACSGGEETAGSMAESSPGPTGVSTTTSEPRTTTMEVDVSPLPVAARLDDVLTTGIEGGGGFGVTAAVSVPGFELWAGSAGDSIRTPDGVVVAMEPDMLFEIGSIDKHRSQAPLLPPGCARNRATRHRPEPSGIVTFERAMPLGKVRPPG